jgi:isopenicillin N synthase-like dioxygenase
MNAFEKIPYIDMSPLFEQPETGLLEVASQVHDIYTTIGFAHLINHGVPADLIQAAFQAAKDFHELPLERKLGIRQNKFFRGHMPQSTSRFALSTLGQATKPIPTKRDGYR